MGKIKRTLFDRPKPAVGCSANGRRRRRRRRQEDEKEDVSSYCMPLRKCEYSQLKEKALVDSAVWRASFGRGYGHFVRQQNEWQTSCREKQVPLKASRYGW